MRSLFLSLLAAVLFATVGLGWVFDNVYEQYQPKNTHEQHDAITAIEKLGSNISVMAEQAEDTEAFIAAWPIKTDYQLHLQTIDSLSLPKNLLQQLITGKSLVLETKDTLSIHYYLNKQKKLMVLTAPLVLVNKSYNFTHFVLTSLFYVCLLLLMLAWLLPLAKRLLALRQTAKYFGQGQLEQRVKIGRITYIRDLEIEFNHMAQRIEDLVSDVKLLSSAVSHDLRTPLASIRFGVDTLQEEDDPALRKKFEQRISDDVDEMIALVETLLTYARLDQAMLTLTKSPVVIEPMIKRIINNKKTDDINVEFIMDDTALTINADANYFMMMLNNLIQNAVQYCHSKIKVEVKTHRTSVVIMISDDGGGINDEAKKNILKPFMRGDKTQNDVKGYGIGLAIVNRVLHWHNGSIEITNDQQLLGAKFIITVPRGGSSA